MKHLLFSSTMYLFVSVCLFPAPLDEMVELLYCSTDTESELNSYNHLNIHQFDNYEKAIFYYYRGRYSQKFRDKQSYSRYLKDMLRGKVLSLHHYTADVDEAISFYKQSLFYIESEMKNSTNAELTALKAEVMSHYSLIEKFRLIVELGMAVEPTAEAALVIDPDNIRARMVIASARAYSPKIYGGDPDEGIRQFSSLIDSKRCRDKLTREQLFNTYAGIAFSWLRKKNREEAEPWLRKARRIYPDSMLVQVLEDWR